jgi:hypothetical protein
METLYFHIGSYYGGSFKVELHYDKIIFTEEKGKYTVSQKVFDIDEHKIENFIKSLDILNVWSWRQSYINPDVSGGKQWEFEIVCKDGRKVKSVGSNMYPDSEENKPSNTFLSLILSLESLMDCKNLIIIN